MPESKPGKTRTEQSAKSTTRRASKGFTDEERAAMRDRAQELKAAARHGPRADGESDVLAKIAEMAEPDRAMAERLHALVRASAPALSPRTWYGMPAYAKGLHYWDVPAWMAMVDSYQASSGDRVV